MVELGYMKSIQAHGVITDLLTRFQRSSRLLIQQHETSCNGEIFDTLRLLMILLCVISVLKGRILCRYSWMISNLLISKSIRHVGVIAAFIIPGAYPPE